MQNVPPTTGSTYPTLTGVGTTTVLETGVGGTVGSYIFSSSNSPGPAADDVDDAIAVATRASKAATTILDQNVLSRW